MRLWKDYDRSNWKWVGPERDPTGTVFTVGDDPQLYVAPGKPLLKEPMIQWIFGPLIVVFVITLFL